MTNVWRKINDKWNIQVMDPNAKSGDEVQVRKASGYTQIVRLGNFTRYGIDCQYFEPAPRGVAVATAPVTSVYTPPPPPPAPVVVATLDLKNINKLFDKAKIHLKFPKIALGLKNDPNGLRITLSGSANPGCISLHSVVKQTSNRWWGVKRVFYGRIAPNGDVTVSDRAPAEMVDLLKEFAADPAKVAASHGHLTGNCCFCSLPLSDERSTAVGYGAVCADHYDLPWGARPQEFAAAA